MTPEQEYQLQHGRLSPELLEKLGVGLIRELAAIKDCDEDKDACEWDSGPICRAHEGNFQHMDLIRRARIFLMAAGVRD